VLMQLKNKQQKKQINGLVYVIKKISSIKAL